jgi:hypothetical protein
MGLQAILSRRGRVAEGRMRVSWNLQLEILTRRFAAPSPSGIGD